MNNSNSPIMRALQHSYNSHPSKSSLLRSLLSLLPNHNVDMKATIDVDETLQELLNLAAHDPDVDKQITNNLLEHYGFLSQLDPSATSTCQQQSDNDSTIARSGESHAPKPAMHKRWTSSTPSLTQIIDNTPNASIWSATDPIFDRQIVLKEYDDASIDPDSKNNHETHFLREAQITGQLEHPNIIPVYAVSWNKHGIPYYTMKHVHGDTLSECIESYHRDNTKHTIQSLRPLLDIFVNVCRAISYAHSRGVIHRDIKPSNIVIGSYGEVMVIDWGRGSIPATFPESLPTTPNAVPAELREDCQTLTEDYPAAPHYRAPEQLANDTVTRLADVYSLGGVLFTLLTGRPPLTGTPLSELIGTDDAEEFPPLETITPSGPIQLVAIVNKAMQCAPKQRYSDVLSLLSDLQAVMVDESIAVCPDTILAASARLIRKRPFLASIAGTILTLGLISLSISTFIVDKSNEQVRVRLTNSRILMREAVLLRDELTAKHSEEALAKESALHSQQIALRQERITAEQADLADSARTDASHQLELSIKLVMDAQQSANRAAEAKADAYEALKATEIGEAKVLQLATVIRNERVRQLTTQANHLIDLVRPGEAILPLVTALTISDNGGNSRTAGLSLANSLMDQSPSLGHIELTQLFSTNFLKPAQLNISTSLACLSFNPAKATYQLLCLPSNTHRQDFKPVTHEIAELPTVVLHNHQNESLVVVIPNTNATSISVYSADTSKPPISFTIGVRVTSAILSPSRHLIIVGTHTGGGHAFDLDDGSLRTILSDVGAPITTLAMHGNSSIAAFATALRVHIVRDPLGNSRTIQSLQLSSTAAGLHFNSAKSLVVVTSRGYVNEYSPLPNAVRRIRFRPPVNGSELRNLSVHPNGAILLDHSSNHLTLLSNKLAETTVQSPLTISVRSMQFSADGQFVLTTTDRRITTIWDCSSMKPRNIPMLSDHLVIAMELNMPNEFLYTLHSDTSLRTWKLPPQNAIATANSDHSHEPTAKSTLARFQLMLTVRPSESDLGITAAQALQYLADRPKDSK